MQLSTNSQNVELGQQNLFFCKNGEVSERPIAVVAGTSHEDVMPDGRQFPGAEVWDQRFVTIVGPGGVFLMSRIEHDKMQADRQQLNDYLRAKIGADNFIEQEGVFQIDFSNRGITIEARDRESLKQRMERVKSIAAFTHNEAVVALGNEHGLTGLMTPDTRKFLQEKVHGVKKLESYGVIFPTGKVVTKWNQAEELLKQYPQAKFVFKAPQGAAGFGASESFSLSTQSTAQKIVNDPVWRQYLSAGGLRMEMWVPDIVGSYGVQYWVSANGKQRKVAQPTRMLMQLNEQGQETSKYRGSRTLLEQEKQYAARMMKQTGLVAQAVAENGGSGYGAVDFIVTKGHQVYCTENNQRFSGQSALMAIREVFGHETGVIFTSKPTRKSLNEILSKCAILEAEYHQEFIVTPVGVIPNLEAVTLTDGEYERQYHYVISGNGNPECMEKINTSLDQFLS